MHLGICGKSYSFHVLKFVLQNPLQALKFDADGNQLLAIGQALQPGHDDAHLCKPTAVRCSHAFSYALPAEASGSVSMHHTAAAPGGSMIHTLYAKSAGSSCGKL